MLKHITVENFNDIVNSDKPVFIDFWAEWCGPCKMLGPTVEQLAEKYGDEAIIGKVNVEEQQALAQHFKVSGIPSVFLIKDKKVVDNLVGVRSKAEYEKAIDSLI